MRLRNPTAAQARVVRQLSADLRVLGVTLPRLLVQFSAARLDPRDLGQHLKILGSHYIDIRPELTGGLLYYTLLHECGHALGLGHTHAGLMAATDVGGFSARSLTLRNRRRWLRELLRLVHAARLEALK